MAYRRRWVGLWIGGMVAMAAAQAQASDPDELDRLAVVGDATDWVEDEGFGDPEAENGEYDDEFEEDFCGGDESVVDWAYMELEEGNLDEAKALLVDAIRTGTVEAWERADAHALLGEVQLRLGQDASAAHNYRRALALDPAGAGAARVGLAAVLLRSGDAAAALGEADRFIAEQCSERIVNPAGCFGALSIRAVTTLDDAVMFESMRAAELLRRPDGDAFARLIESIDPAHAPATPTAAIPATVAPAAIAPADPQPLVALTTPR